MAYHKVEWIQVWVLKLLLSINMKEFRKSNSKQKEFLCWIVAGLKIDGFLVLGVENGKGCDNYGCLKAQNKMDFEVLT